MKARRLFEQRRIGAGCSWALWKLGGIALWGALLASLCAGENPGVAKQTGGFRMECKDSCHRQYLIGVKYFAGWWEDEPNKYIPHGRDWRLDFPERIPLLGEYNDQATMDREIIAASEHGVDFFQILWYYQDPDRELHPRQERLNDGLQMFTASRESHRMSFMLEITNHPPFLIESEDEWERCCREWCEAMKHPSYLHIDGKPVIKIHSAYGFFQESGNDAARAVARIETLRRIARDAGLPELIIGGGTGGVGTLESGLVVAHFDYLSTYMDMPNVPQRDELYPYEDLFRHALQGWMRYALRSDKPYVPYVPAGWDPRPWKDPRPSFEMPTREEWEFALKRTMTALDKHPNLGIPTSDSGRQKIFTIYAWNEYGEGGYLAPTRGEGTMKLQAIREVFGR